MRTRLIFVRHAEAQGNYKREFHGWTDEGITGRGRKQALRVAERLRDVSFEYLYSSSMLRTMQTAEAIAEVKELPIIRTDKLKEINGGEWEGRPWDELPRLYPDAYETWEYRPHEHCMPNGETMIDFRERLIKEVEYIIRKHEGKDVCIVTHGTAIKALICCFKKCDLSEMLNIQWCDNTAITIVEYQNDRYTFILEGDASHLDKETSTLQNQKWFLEHKEKLNNNS